jgi:hypothetical protein
MMASSANLGSASASEKHAHLHPPRDHYQHSVDVGHHHGQGQPPACQEAQQRR